MKFDGFGPQRQFFANLPIGQTLDQKQEYVMLPWAEHWR
jgi:hypothetical protein